MELIDKLKEKSGKVLCVLGLTVLAGCAPVSNQSFKYQKYLHNGDWLFIGEREREQGYLVIDEREGYKRISEIIPEGMYGVSVRGVDEAERIEQTHQFFFYSGKSKIDLNDNKRFEIPEEVEGMKNKFVLGENYIIGLVIALRRGVNKGKIRCDMFRGEEFLYSGEIPDDMGEIEFEIPDNEAGNYSIKLFHENKSLGDYKFEVREK
jgi:hypothetical protein